MRTDGRRWRRLWRLAALGLMVAAAPCGSATPEDFAVWFSLEVPDAAPLVAVQADARVLRRSARADLGDARVFDATGRRMAQVVEPPPAALPEPVALPLFPLPGEARAAGESGLRVEVTPGGAVVSVDGPAADEPVTRWLVDASDLGAPLGALDVSWSATATPFLARVRLATSRDLERWRDRGVVGALAELERAGRTLRRDRLDTGTLTAPYLRLELIGGAPALTAVSAVPTVPDGVTPPQVELEGRARDGHWLYDLGGPLPVAALSLPATGPPLVFDAMVATASDREGPFVPRARAGFFRLPFGDEGTVVAEPVRLDVAGERWLRLTPAAGAPAVAPPLIALLRPLRLVFAAAGQPPYRLAVGRAGLEPVRSEGLVELLARDGTEPVVVTPGAMRTVAGDAARRSDESALAWLLWAVLLAGLGLLAVMLRRLLREMGSEP